MQTTPHATLQNQIRQIDGTRYNGINNQAIAIQVNQDYVLIKSFCGKVLFSGTYGSAFLYIETATK